MRENESTSPGVNGQNAGSSEGTIVSKVRDTATAQLTTQKNRATDGLGSVAQAVRQSTQQLREQNHDTLADYAEQAADQIERFSQRLRDKDIGEMLSDVQGLARSQPALFIGGAFALGLVGARFFKSSARQGGGVEREWRGPSPSSGAGTEFRGYAGAAGATSAPSSATVHDYQHTRSMSEEVGTPVASDSASIGEDPIGGRGRAGGGGRSRRTTQTERS